MWPRTLWEWILVIAELGAVLTCITFMVGVAMVGLSYR
jgi:hypothetical protein